MNNPPGHPKECLQISSIVTQDRRRAYICWTHDTTDLFHGVEIGAETAVHSEDLLIDNGGNRETVEAVGESLPELDVVSSLALVVEAVDTVDRGALVVTAKNEEIFWVFDLVCEEETDGFERLLASVYIVAEEEVVGLWWETSVLEQAQEVVVLAVNITTYLCAKY